MPNPEKTKAGHRAIAGSHKMPDHWEHGRLLVLSNSDRRSGNVLRLCIRCDLEGGRPGDRVSLDLSPTEADRFAATVFDMLGYAVSPRPVPQRKQNPGEPFWHVYRWRSSDATGFHVMICQHGLLSVAARQPFDDDAMAALARWLADRLEWDLEGDTSAAA